MTICLGSIEREGERERLMGDKERGVIKVSISWAAFDLELGH